MHKSSFFPCAMYYTLTAAVLTYLLQVRGLTTSVLYELAQSEGKNSAGF